jgi:hypothetical protein
MQKLFGSAAAAAGALLVTQWAHAHSFICEKTVNGSNFLEVSSYPATLQYEITVTNNHPTDASTAQSVSDASLAMLGFAFEPAAPFTLGVGQSVTDTFDVVLASAEDCMTFAGSDGVADDRMVNEFVVTWDKGAAQCSATVVCKAPPPPPPPPPEGGATRTPGFFKTHEDALAACLAEGAIDLGILSIDSPSAALGLLWGSPAAFDTDEKRDDLEKARFLLARHTLVGTCNLRLFGTEPDPSDLLAQAVAALSGTDCSLMHDLAEDIDDFNNSGDDEDFPEGFEPGPATPRHAASIADDPTMPSDEQCSG